MPNAIRFHAPGDADVLRWEDVAVPPPAEGELRVRHRAVGLNFIDVYHRSGLYPVPSLPSGIGSEAVGVVEALGPGVAGFAAGDRVGYATVPLDAVGACSEVRNVPASKVVKVPDAVDDRIAAASLLKGMTAEYLIRRCFRVESGMTVLLHAAAGGVGSIAAQWLSSLGARVIGTVGSDDKVDIARQRGCHEVIVTSREDLARRVGEITDGRGVAVVYDGVGAATWDASLKCLARRGTMVSFGNASGPVPTIEPMTLSRLGSLHLTRPRLHDYTATREELDRSAADVFEVIADGRVRIDVSQTFALRDCAAAHRALEARRTTGQTVLLPD